MECLLQIDCHGIHLSLYHLKKGDTCPKERLVLVAKIATLNIQALLLQIQTTTKMHFSLLRTEEKVF